MNSVARHRLRIPTAAGVLVALTLTVVAAGGSATAREINPRVLPPRSRSFGKTYGAWSAAWWKYVLAQPASSSPLVDETGAGCGVGQSGPVFFLVGTNGGGTATRDECTVRAGKAVFFPLLNAFDVHTPGDGLNSPQKVWDDLHRTIGFGPFSELHASVDGVRVANLDPATTPYRACAGPVARCSARPFSLTFPADNFFPPLPGGTYAPAVADGFYLLLAPLTPGHHSINFGGTGVFGGNPFSEDITYNLLVAAA